MPSDGTWIYFHQLPWPKTKRMGGVLLVFHVVINDIFHGKKNVFISRRHEDAYSLFANTVGCRDGLNVSSAANSRTSVVIGLPRALDRRETIGGQQCSKKQNNKHGDGIIFNK